MSERRRQYAEGGGREFESRTVLQTLDLAVQDGRNRPPRPDMTVIGELIDHPRVAPPVAYETIER